MKKRGRKVSRSARRIGSAKRVRRGSLRKKDYGNVVAYIVLALLLLILVLLAIESRITGYQLADDPRVREAINAGQSVNPTGAGVGSLFIDPVVDLLKGWSEGRISETSAKWLFLALLTLFIFSILDMAPIFGLKEHKTVQFFIALIISFLSIAYIAPQDIWIILTSYSALGTTLLVLIPFTILMLYTYRVVEDNNVRMYAIQKVVWLLYTVALIFFYFYGGYSGKIQYTNTIGWVYIVMIAVSLFFFLGNQSIVRYLGKITSEAQKEAGRRNVDQAIQGVQNSQKLQQGYEGLNPGSAG